MKKKFRIVYLLFFFFSYVLFHNNHNSYELEYEYATI